MLRAHYILAMLSIALYCSTSLAAKYTYVAHTRHQLIGHIRTIQSRSYDTFNQLARTHDIGHDELKQANPNVNPYRIPTGSVIILPTQYILPDTPHRGIVINLPEKRLYLYQRSKVFTFPIGIGRSGWTTPVGQLHIIGKMKNPAWYVPQSVRIEQAKNGNHLPKVVPPGPNNPLGQYALRLSKPNYLIHGTHEPSGVGRRSSAGCLRMYPEDIRTLYTLTQINTPVLIVKQPLKTAKIQHRFFIESHAPLIETVDDQNLKDGANVDHTMTLSEALTHLLDTMKQANIKPISTTRIRTLLLSSTGIPVLTGKSF